MKKRKNSKWIVPDKNNECLILDEEEYIGWKFMNEYGESAQYKTADGILHLGETMTSQLKKTLGFSDMALNSSGRITTTGKDGTISEAVTQNDVESILKEYLKQFEYKPTFEHRCNNCGGTLELKIDQHIFNCPYCNSVYAIGTNNIN